MQAVLDPRIQLHQPLALDHAAGEHLIDVAEIVREATLDLRECLGVGVKVSHLEWALGENQRAAVAPPVR